MRGFMVSFTIALGLAQLSFSQVNKVEVPQDTASQESFSLTLDVRQVPVDVVVLDEAGNPVKGLKPGDFTVQEDGKQQKVQSFEWFDGSATYTPPKIPNLPPNTYVNLPHGEEKGPLYILYFDMVNMAEVDQMSFHHQLLDFIDHAPAGVRIALFVNAKGLHLLQGFTTDRALLKNAVLEKGNGPHVPNVFIYRENYGMYDAGAALSNLRFIAHYLEGIPGKKNLLWLASKCPIPVAPILQGTGQIPTAGAAPRLYSVGAQGGPQVLDLTGLMRDQVQHTYAALMRSQIAIYPVNVTGPDPNRNPGDTLTEYELEDMIAEATGGKAFHGNNRVPVLLNKAIDHGRSYYTLTYSPSNTKYDGSERTIRVQLHRKGKYILTYRTAYYALSDDQAFKQKRGDELQERFLKAKLDDRLYANIEHGAPMLHDLLFSAHLEKDGSARLATPEQMQALEDAPDYFKTRRKNPNKPLTPVKLQKYVIHYDVVDPLVRKAIAGHKQSTTLEFAAAAYNEDGRLLNSMLNKGVASANLNARNGGTFQAVQELEAPPGAVYIRLAVRDAATDRTGTLEVKLPLKDERQVAQK